MVHTQTHTHHFNYLDTMREIFAHLHPDYFQFNIMHIGLP